ncbi:MAG: hypothetical protein RH946_03550 [Rhodospirillales bacterium]
MRTSILLVLCLILISACAGRTANPVSEYQYGDEKKSCERLRAEIADINAEIAALLPETDKTGENVALGVAGAFLLVPWFFMDFSEAEQIEVNALRRRHNNLVAISAEKDCGFSYETIPPFTPKKEDKAPQPAT